MNKITSLNHKYIFLTVTKLIILMSLEVEDRRRLVNLRIVSRNYIKFFLDLFFLGV